MPSSLSNCRFQPTESAVPVRIAKFFRSASLSIVRTNSAYHPRRLCLLFTETTAGRLASVVVASAVAVVGNPFVSSGADVKVYQPEFEQIVYESSAPTITSHTIAPISGHLSPLFPGNFHDHAMQPKFPVHTPIFSSLHSEVGSLQASDLGFDDIVTYRQPNETGLESAPQVEELGWTKDDLVRLL